MNDFSEKRLFSRLDVDANISFQIPGTPRHHYGKTKNFSGGGLQFYCELDVPVGSIIKVELSVDDNKVQPLSVNIRIIRSEHVGEYYRISAEVAEVLE